MISITSHNSYNPATLPKCFVEAHNYLKIQNISTAILFSTASVGVLANLATYIVGLVLIGSIPSSLSVFLILFGTFSAGGFLLIAFRVASYQKENKTYSLKELDSENMMAYYKKELELSNDKSNPELEKFWNDYQFTNSLTGRRTDENFELQESTSS